MSARFRGRTCHGLQSWNARVPDRNASSRCLRHAACHAALSSLAMCYHKPKVIRESRTDVILANRRKSADGIRSFLNEHDVYSSHA